MTFDGPAAIEGSLVVTGSDARPVRSPLSEDLTLQSMCDAALAVLINEGVPNGQLDLHLLDSEAMAALNKEHMGHDEATDVLSFPLDAQSVLDAAEAEPGAGSENVPPSEVVLLGDVVVCPEVAVAQAAAHVGSVDGEFHLLVIHGVLHVLGHDHAEVEETHEMQQREREHLRRLGFDHPVAAP